ncbi:hypothetical protein F1880_001280 [Penicillium rolfsii]|nr:hypothetical protein F1880_001280 [Penicillium rolfsii]
MEADVEMNDAGNLSEADSLASTVPSEQGSEYEVEEILAERVSKRTGKKKYLLKWANYPIYRATWEPAEMFLEMEDAMLKWDEKTRKVRAGIDQPFDVHAWKKSLKDRERETQRRKEARRQKRAARAARAAQENDSNAHPPSRESSPDVPLMRTSRLSSPDVPLAPASKTRGASLASELFVSIDDPEPKTTLTDGKPPEMPIPQSPQVSSSSGFAQAGLKPPDSPETNVPENSEKLLTQSCQDAAVIPSENSQPAPRPKVPDSTKSTHRSQSSQLTLETSKTTSSTQNRSSPGTGKTSATKGNPPQKSRRSLLASQATKQPALGPLYNAFVNKTKDREPDISQLDLRKPSEFPARTAAGVPVPFAKITATDKSRRSSQSGTKIAPTFQPALSGSSRRVSPETMGPPSRPRASSPRGFSLLNGADCYRLRESSRPGDYDSYRPGNARDSSPPPRPDRGRSLEFRRSSPGARSRSPNRRSRSPERRRRSPVLRPRSPHRVDDLYRPKNSSPFVTVTRPKAQMQTPVAASITRQSPPTTVTHTENDTDSMNTLNTDAVSLSTRLRSPPQAPVPAKEQISTKEQMSAKELIERMPIGRPESGCRRFITNGYFVNKGEVLAHIYFGTEKHFIGAVRLCGLSTEVKQDLLAAKQTGKFEMWFKHLCTPEQYATLCREEKKFGGSNRVIRTCWMEGFADTNPEVFHMSEQLYWERKIGIYYPPENQGFVWLAYSPKTPEFASLTQSYPEINPWVPIRLAVRTPLAPIDALGEQQTEPQSQQQMGPQHPQVQNPAIAMVPYDPSNPSVIGASGSLDDVLKRPGHTSGLSNLHATGLIKSNLSTQVQGSYGTPMQNPMERSLKQHPLPSQAAHSQADPRLRHLSLIATSTQQPSGHLISMGGLPDTMDTRPDTTVPSDTALIPANQNISILQSTDPRQLSNFNSMLHEYFESNLKMSFKELACVNGKPNGPQADVFYLHSPERSEDQNDCTLLKAWLELHGAMVWSDWGKFVKNSKCGVILFHESFGKYQALQPKIRDVLPNPSMGFWTYRISRPLDFPDERYCQKGVYFQRIFPNGGAYLLTEDVLYSLKEAVAIVYWFHSVQTHNMGRYKLVLWPNLMERLEEKQDDPNLSKQEQKLLGVLILLIGKCNSVDPHQPRFKPDSLDATKLDRPNNNVLSLKVAGYGERLATPGDLTQDERNADRLAESFAGWAVENAARIRRSYIISSCKNKSLLTRWASWGHAHLFNLEAWIEKYKINVDESLQKIEKKLSKSNKPGKSSQSGQLDGLWRGQPSDRPHNDMSSPMQTPQTPIVAGTGSVPTPRDPDGGDVSNCPRPSEWRPPQPQESHQYGAPYR